MPTICITLTSPFVLNAFLLGHIARLSQSFRIVVCINRLESDIPITLPLGAELHHVEIRREIALFRDLQALWRLACFYRSEKFAAVISVTPKGGLLAMVAARLAGVPIRVHWFTGQVWASKTGVARALFKLIDRLLASCASGLLADSPSQRDYLVNEGIVMRKKIDVIGAGSISGVNLARFRVDPRARSAVRAELGIPIGDLCLLYVGRMKKDKGVPELLAAFGRLHGRYPQLHLLMVGPDEEQLLAGHHEDGFHCVGYTPKVEAYMAAADIICLPSYREGFGTVLIEAAASGLPAVASRIYGITDAVVDGETGLLHEVGSVPGIEACLQRLLTEPALRLRLASQARLRSSQLFSSERIETLFADWILAKVRVRSETIG